MVRRILHIEKPGSARNFDEFRHVPDSAKVRVRRRTGGNYANPVLVEKSVVKGAVDLVDSIRSFSRDEKEIAKEVLKYVKNNSTAHYADIHVLGAGKYRGQLISFRNKSGVVIKQIVGPGTVKRICDELILKGLIIDSAMLERIKIRLKKKK